MDEIIKQIRGYLNMSQTEFAELMNVSFGTVNRWENGRALRFYIIQNQSSKQKPVAF